MQIIVTALALLAGLAVLFRSLRKLDDFLEEHPMQDGNSGEDVVE